MTVVERSTPRDGVALITLNRPDKLNALNAALVESLHCCLSDIARDQDTRVVILTGAGRGFCAGLDLGGYGDAPRAEQLGSTRRFYALQQHIASLIPRLRSLPQPVIAAVNGPAAGGGLALVLGSDVRLASTTARFNAAFIRIGASACDIGTSWLLPRIVGVARAQELMLTGRIIDADEALRTGLVVELHASEVLLDAALTKADQIMANAPFAVTLTKEGMWTALEIPSMQVAIDFENRQQFLSTRTDDHLEAMRAQIERRPAVFTNR